MTATAQDDHLTAGAWAACVHTHINAISSGLPNFQKDVPRFQKSIVHNPLSQHGIRLFMYFLIVQFIQLFTIDFFQQSAG